MKSQTDMLLAGRRAVGGILHACTRRASSGPHVCGAAWPRGGRATVVRISALTALLASTACSRTPSGVCDVCATSAIVYGTVTDATDQPYVRLPLAVRTYVVDCGVPVWLRGGDTFSTDSTGSFRRRVYSLDSPHTAQCIRVITNPAGGEVWPTDTVDFRLDVEFRFIDTDERLLDSVRLAVMLPH